MRIPLIVLAVALLAGDTWAAAPPKKAKPPPKPSLALLPIEGILPERDLRSVEDELRRALPGQNYVVQTRDRTQRTLFDLRALGLSCDTGVVDCLVQVGGLAGVNLILRGGLTSLDVATDQLELLGVDVNAMKERNRVKVRVPRGDPAGRAAALRSALTGVLRPEAWRGQLRLAVKQGLASVYVDGVPRGITPLAEPIELTPGEHAVYVGLESHRAFKQTVVVPYDDEVAVEVVLEPGVAEPPPRFATTATTAAPSTATTVSPRKPPLRVVVYDVEVVGLEPRVGRVMGQLLVDEIRKRERVSVLDSGELRAIVGDGSSTARDFRGCSAAECFAEVAEALGAEAVVAAQLTLVGGDVLFGLRRIDPLKQEVTVSFSERAPATDTNKLLPLVGRSVAQAFAEQPLRKGVAAGVDASAERRLNPPPLAPVPATTAWVAAVTASTGGIGALVAAGVAATLHNDGLRAAQARAPDDKLVRDDSSGILALADAVGWLVPVGVVGVASGVVAAGAALGLGPFTDWEGQRAGAAP